MICCGCCVVVAEFVVVFVVGSSTCTGCGVAVVFVVGVVVSSTCTGCGSVVVVVVVVLVLGSAVAVGFNKNWTTTKAQNNRAINGHDAIR
jgi:hypothetical protein